MGGSESRSSDIENMQGDMDLVSQTIGTGRQRSLDASGVMRRLVAVAMESSESSAQVTASSQQQWAGLEQIAQAIHSINEASNQSTSGTRQVEQEVQRPQKLALELKSLMAAGTQQ